MQTSLQYTFKRRWGAPALVFVVAFVLRAAVAVALPQGILWPDGERYVAVAENLLEGRGFGSLEQNAASVPTQPLLIAASRLVFGESFLALRLVFSLIGAASCVLAFWIGGRLFGWWAGVLAGSMLALYPYHLYLSALFEYPQGFFIAVMAVAFAALLRFEESRSRPMLLLAGVALGLAVLSVPTILVFLPFAALWVVSISTPRRLPLDLVSIGLGLVVTVAPWTVRNQVQYGEPILVNAAGGANFWVANNETYARYGKRAVILGCAEPERYRYCTEILAAKDSLSHLDEVNSILAFERLAWRRGLEFIREDPVRFGGLTARKFATFWSPVPNAVYTESGQTGTLQTVVSLVTYTPVLILAVLGLVATRHQWRRLWLIYAYLGSLTLAYTVFLPTTRYRLPLDFFLILFAAALLAPHVKRHADARSARRRHRAVAGATTTG